MKLRSLHLSILIILFLVMANFFAMAQPGGGDEDPDVPITGIEILLAAGGVLGIKRIMGFNRKSKKP